MKRGLEVFDFNEEDELAETVHRKYLDKCKNPNLNHPVLKYEFLKFGELHCYFYFFALFCFNFSGEFRCRSSSRFGVGLIV